MVLLGPAMARERGIAGLNKIFRPTEIVYLYIPLTLDSMVYERNREKSKTSTVKLFCQKKQINFPQKSKYQVCQISFFFGFLRKISILHIKKLFLI